MSFDSMDIKVTVFPSKKTETIEMQKNDSVTNLLKKLGLQPDTVIVLRGKTPIPIDDVLLKNDDLSIIRVASGG